MVTVKRFFSSQLGLWFVIAGFGVYMMMYMRRHIAFGIDLVGGTYLALQVQTQSLLEQELLSIAAQVKTHVLQNNNDREPVVSLKIADRAVSIDCFSDEQARLAKQFISNLLPGQNEVLIDIVGGVLTVSFTPEYQIKLNRQAVQRNIEVLQRRLDASGVAEISVSAVGHDRIVVELPNVTNPEEARERLGRSATLGMSLVYAAGKTEQDIIDTLPGKKVPDDQIIISAFSGNDAFYLIDRAPAITGSAIKTAEAKFDEMKYEPVINFALHNRDSQIFYQLTKQNIGKRLAIVLDNKILTAPVIQSAIDRGGVITGFRNNLKEAQEIALLLRSGAFAAPVSIVEERHIGPSLGSQSIQQGLWSCLMGLVVLGIFSVVVYKIPGIFAFIVLLFNLVVTFILLSLVGATLTLPGIAGLVLSIGMAIDASILIYERIKEELRKGRPLPFAVDAGFAGALWVIVDANITHLLVAAVLYKLGTGPVQGFAVTMIIGIIATLLTGLWLLRAIFDFCINGLGIQKLRF